MVQGMVDPDRAEADRALDLCSVLEPGPHFALLAMAADGRRGLVGGRPDRGRGASSAFRFWVGVGSHLNVSDQPFRSVRAASGLALPDRQAVRAADLRDAGPLPHCAASVI